MGGLKLPKLCVSVANYDFNHNFEHGNATTAKV